MIKCNAIVTKNVLDTWGVGLGFRTALFKRQIDYSQITNFYPMIIYTPISTQLTLEGTTTPDMTPFKSQQYKSTLLSMKVIHLLGE